MRLTLKGYVRLPLPDPRGTLENSLNRLHIRFHIFCRIEHLPEMYDLLFAVHDRHDNGNFCVPGNVIEAALPLGYLMARAFGRDHQNEVF